ncbi:MAG: hypothetical protein JST12_18545 [Armatimonadetes bacterium]|nr:hypothetical protein [Armatimonadota bacterium]
MVKLAGGGESLGEAKAKSFGEVLRAAIKEEFGTSKAFAAALGVSPGRVSQLIGGPDAVDASTLTSILKAFQIHHLRESLHSAWIREFAPMPTENLRLHTSEGLLVTVDQGRIGLPSRQIAKMLDQQRETEQDFELWFALSERLVHFHNRRCESSSALNLLSQMEQRALEVQDSFRVAKVLWMRSVALRNLGVSWKILEEAGNQASAYRSAVEPTRADSRWRELAANAERDAALSILAGVESGNLGRVALDRAIELLDRSESRIDDLALYYFGQEARARITLALGNLAKTEDLLEDLQTEGTKHHFDLTERLAFLSAGVNLHRGKTEEATEGLGELMRQSQAKGNLHHARKADKALVDIALRAKGLQ